MSAPAEGSFEERVRKPVSELIVQSVALGSKDDPEAMERHDRLIQKAQDEVFAEVAEADAALAELRESWRNARDLAIRHERALAAEREKVERVVAHNTALAAEITALKEWRPMEDAPRDGTSIICLDPSGKPGLFGYSGGVWWDAYQDRYGSDTLLGWLPLPAAPTDTEADEADQRAFYEGQVERNEALEAERDADKEMIRAMNAEVPELRSERDALREAAKAAEALLCTPGAVTDRAAGVNRSKIRSVLLKLGLALTREPTGEPQASEPCGTCEGVGIVEETRDYSPVPFVVKCPDCAEPASTEEGE